MDSLDSLSIVIPAYNEQARLPSTLSSILRYMQSRTWAFWEVLVVNDGSQDATARLTTEFQATHANFRLLNNPGNRGKGYSVRHGVLEARGNWILFTDADLSAPIEELATLEHAMQAHGAALVMGSRALDRSLIQVHQSRFRETAGRIFNLIMRLATALPFRDTQCGFKLFEARTAQEVFRRQRIERWGFDVEVLYLARKLGYKAVETPVRWSHSAGTNIRMFRDSLNMFLDLLRVRWYDLRGCYRQPNSSHQL